MRNGGEGMKRKAQSMAEYAVLIAVFLAAVIAAQGYVKRAIAGKFKSSGDRISTEQFGSTYNSTSWDQASSNEITGTAAGIGAGYWSDSTLVSSGLGLESQIGLGYAGGQVSRKDWGIGYNLKGGNNNLWEE